VRKIFYVIDSKCFGGNIDFILELKETLSTYFKVPIKNIEIVGSAKLGLSLSKDRFGKKYDNNSDIDLVLVSSELFDEAWHELLKLEYKFHQLSTKERAFLDDCYGTLHRGFISPEKLPPKTDFHKYWWRIFSNLSNKEIYEYRKIRGRLFKDWWFVEKYYSINLKKISQLQGEGNEGESDNISN
jgi:hypothetical protein